MKADGNPSRTCSANGFGAQCELELPQMPAMAGVARKLAAETGLFSNRFLQRSIAKQGLESTCGADASLIVLPISLDYSSQIILDGSRIHPRLRNTASIKKAHNDR